MNLTRGEIEAAVCDGVVRLLRETYGHGPRMVRACLLGNHLTITAEGVLTTSENTFSPTTAVTRMVTQPS